MKDKEGQVSQLMSRRGIRTHAVKMESNDTNHSATAPGYYYVCVVLNQMSLVCKVYSKHRKQTLLQRYLDYHGHL